MLTIMAKSTAKRGIDGPDRGAIAHRAPDGRVPVRNLELSRCCVIHAVWSPVATSCAVVVPLRCVGSNGQSTSVTHCSKDFAKWLAFGDTRRGRCGGGLPCFARAHQLDRQTTTRGQWPLPRVRLWRAPNR